MPKRSTGCAACRRRKIRCDEGRPQCEKCLNHGIPCPGYRTLHAGGIDILDQTSRVVQKVQAKRGGDLEFPSGSLLSGNQPRPGQILLNSSTGEHPNSTDRNGEEAAMVLPPMVNAGPENQTQAFIIAMNMYIPSLSRIMIHRHHTDLTVLATVDLKQPALKTAINALSLAQIGTSWKDRRILVEAQKMYGLALKTLASTLTGAGEAAYKDKELTATILVLSHLEYFRSLHQFGSWTLHAGGLGDLLRQRGPRPPVTAFDVMIFHQTRHLLLMRGYSTRKRMFLERPEWIQASQQSTMVDRFSTLLDIVVRVPGLLEDTDVEERDGLTNSSDLVNRLMAILSELEDWHTTSRSLYDDMDYTTEDITSFTRFWDLTRDDTFPLAYRFQNFMTAYSQVSFWTARCFCQTALLGVLRRHVKLTSPATMYGLHKELMQNTRNVCMTVPYFSEPGGGSMSIMATFMSLRFGGIYFGKMAMLDEASWCTKAGNAIWKSGIAPPYLEKQESEDWVMSAAGDTQQASYT